MNCSRILGDHVELLFADGLDAAIGVGQLDAAQPVDDPHHLLLVDHHAVGFGQDFFHHRMLILGLFRPCLTWM